MAGASFEDHLTPYLTELGAWAHTAAESGLAEAARIGDDVVQALSGATPKGKTQETAGAWRRNVLLMGDTIELHVTIPGAHSSESGEPVEFNQILDWLEKGNHANNPDGFIHAVDKQAIAWKGADHPVHKVRPMQGKPFAQETFDRATAQFEERVADAIEKGMPS